MFFRLWICSNEVGFVGLDSVIPISGRYSAVGDHEIQATIAVRYGQSASRDGSHVLCFLKIGDKILPRGRSSFTALSSALEPLPAMEQDKSTRWPSHPVFKVPTQCGEKPEAESPWAPPGPRPKHLRTGSPPPSVASSSWTPSPTTPPCRPPPLMPRSTSFFPRYPAAPTRRWSRRRSSRRSSASSCPACSLPSGAPRGRSTTRRGLPSSSCSPPTSSARCPRRRAPACRRTCTRRTAPR